MNVIAIIIKLAVAAGIGYYAYAQLDVSAWLSAMIFLCAAAAAVLMKWDGNSPTSGP